MEEKKLTGYPSIDKPWLKYYSEEALNAPLPECTIYEYLWENNKDHLDDIAIIYFNRKITYGELFRNIDKTAAAFSAFDVKPREVVAVCMASTPEALYVIYALNKIGAIPDLLDPRANAEGFKFFLEESKARILFTIDSSLDKFNEAKGGTNIQHTISVSPAESLSVIKRCLYKLSSRIDKHDSLSWKQFLTNKSGIIDSDTTGESLAVIVHTGGTTGVPKGVMLSNKSINSIAHQYRMMAHYDRNQMLLDIIPPFASYGLCTSIHMPLSLGLSVTLIPKFNPEEFGDLIIKYKPNYVMGVPSFWLSLLKNQKYKDFDLSFLVCAACGGDSMSKESEAELNSFFNEHGTHIMVDKGYGMSEMSATAVTCYGNVNALGSVGIPMICNNISIVDPDSGKELPYENEGEICLTGPGMMIGYLNNDQLTNKTIKMHPDGKRWIHTGDLGHFNKDGFLFHDGRIKRMFVRFDGFKIYPESVEKVIMQNKKVASCAVIGCNTERIGILPIAYIQLKENCDKHIVSSEILESCKIELAERAVPYRIIFIEKLPLTNLGKIDYRALEKQAEEMSKE